MAKITNEDEGYLAAEPRELVTVADNTPVRISDLLKSMGLMYEQVPARSLVDHEITILRGKPFASAFKAGETAWYCTVLVDGDPEPKNVVLGGGAVTEMIEALANAGIEAPVVGILRWKEGGKYSGYYVLE